MKKALKELELEDETKVVFRAFELYPTAKKEPHRNIVEAFARHYGMTPEQAQQRVDYICEMGRGEGLVFNYGTAYNTNSFDSLRLAKLAQSKGNDFGNVFIERMYKAFFEENIIVADHGYMQTTPDDHYLLFTLFKGYTYNEQTDGENALSRPLTSIGFDKQILTFDISDFAFKKSDEDFFNGHYQMLNVAQLDSNIGSLEQSLDSRYTELENNLNSKMRVYAYYSSKPKDSSTYMDIAQRMADTNRATRNKILNQARANAYNAQNDIQMYTSIIDSDQEYINRHYIELMRKFTLSVACILLFLIGAPFGSIVRRGGLGMPLVASVVFFVLYYVVGMICEKSVRESAMTPLGMWVSTFVFIPIGALLTWQATTDSSLFDLATWKRWLHIKSKLQKDSSPTSHNQPHPPSL
jgi:lipopolysaccharide export system permease protein